MTTHRESEFSGILMRLRHFRYVRNWGDVHTPKMLAESVSIEAAELLELFQWGASPKTDQIEGEVADVMIYCLNLCDVAGIDPVTAIHKKITINEGRM